MNLSLEYLIKTPKIIKEKNPLLLLLHGYGSNEEDLFSFAQELPEDFYIISARAPYNLQYGSYAWYSINFDSNQNKFSNNEQAKISLNLISKFIDELIENYPIDNKKINLIGFSQGAILSYALALSYPKKVNKIVALSGYLNLDILVDDYLKNSFSDLNFFISHGTFDQVIPISWAQKSLPILEKLGINITYKEYPVGHGVSPQNFYDFKYWITNQKL